MAAEDLKLRERALALFAARDGRPAALEYFEDAVRSEDISAGDGPLLGVFCNFVPAEVVEAAGAVPVRLCSGSVVAQSVGEQMMPRDTCPVARATFGAVAGGFGLASRVRAVVVPTSCDAKRRLAEFLSDYVPVLSLSIPPRNDYRTELPYWVSELERLAEGLSRITGVTPTRARLEAAILRRRARQDAFRDLGRARLRYPHVLAGSDLALVAAAAFAAESSRWAEATRRLASEVRTLGEARPRPADFVPLVLTGAPLLWPAWKLYDVIQSAGGSVVADTLCSVTQGLDDPVQVDDWSRAGIMRALALRYFAASLCPCFMDTTALTDRVFELVHDWKAQGVVAHNLRLCQLAEMQSARLRHILRDKGIPFLAVDTELGTEDVEQVRVRVEAFMEMIRERPCAQR
jgi:benzoyl-CoA reductase/2-hydroxyglutaryl-CoA dehydratase subunit BcrC/BadD/HgdB